MKKIALILGLMFWIVGLCLSQEGIYKSEKGEIHFESKATLETIEAKSNELNGVLQPDKKAFAFTVDITSFKGFNSDIQQTHFQEDYMETETYPKASFKGKLIEDIPFDTPGTYQVRAKGELMIHGIAKERIIKGTITIRPGSIQIQSDFSVPLADHGISIPRIVNQKIAEQIMVNIRIEFAQGSKT